MGWTLLHFLWQGTAIVIVYAILRGLLARSLSARGRYALACVALLAMVVAPPLTYLVLPNTAIVSSRTTAWAISVSEFKALLPGIAPLWLLGVLAFSLRLFGAWRFTARLRSTSHAAPAEWQQTLQEIGVILGISSVGTSMLRLRLLVSSRVDVPTVIGWLRPVILVPLGFLTALPAEYICALLAHELGHIRRRDYLASILQSLAETVLFYHPAVWWISEQIRVERELCCDDLAVAATVAGARGDVLTYARALAELESRQPSHLNPALAANGGSLVNRIRRLIEPPHASANNLPSPAGAWAMILLWLAGVGVATVHAAQTPLPLPPVNLNPLPLNTAISRRDPFNPVAAFATHARRTLIYDPFLSAQLAQPTSRAQSVATPDSPWSRWLDEDVAWIITDAERTTFNQLKTDRERELFVEQFWLRRDPTPDTIQNEFQEEHYRRIAYANEHFASRIPGWKTDRGRVYITYGPPDEIASHPSAGDPASVPFEDWRYRYLEGIGNGVIVEFVDPSGTGDYRWAADPAQGRASSEPTAPLQPAPPPKFKLLEDAIGKLTTYEVLPMQVRIDYLRVTASSVLANITIQFEIHDLQFEANNGLEKSTVNILGRITTMTRRPVAAFEKPLEINAPTAMLQTFSRQRSIYQQSVPLAPGRYRLNIVAKDMVSGRLNNYEVGLDVPQFDAGKLASSSLIFADAIERLPASSVSGAAFLIGSTTVRPRLGNRFTKGEKVGIYLQVYNFGPGDNTRKPLGSIEYEIDKAGSNEKIMDFSEDAGSIPNASADQVTIEKLLPLNTFEPGAYTLKVTATDRNGNQTLQQQGNFTVALE